MKDSEKYKEEISKIEVSKQLEEKILKKTIEKKKSQKKSLKVVYACGFLAVISIISLSAVHAEEIKQLFVRWSAAISLEDGTKLEISKDNTSKNVSDKALKTEEAVSMSIDEIESMIGFPVLKPDVEQKPQFSYSTYLNKDGTIGVIDLATNYDAVFGEDSHLYFSIAILNKHVDQSFIFPFSEGRNAVGGKIIENQYTSPKFNVKVVLFRVDWDSSRLTAEFLYQNIFYSILGQNVTQEEMMKLIESLKY